MQTLHLSGVKTISALDVGREIVAHAEVTLTPERCPECKHKDLYAFGTRTIRYQDLPMHGEQVLINLKRQRYHCRNKKCGHTFMPDHPEFDSQFRMTKRAVQYVEQWAPFQTFAFISQHIGIEERTVRRVFWRYAQNKEKELKTTAGKVLGIDELYLLKKFRCILTNISERTVIDILADRERPRIIRFLRKLDGIKEVERVAMDMWPSYKLACKAVIPDVPITVDKFHVLKAANLAMEEIRKETQRQLPRGKKLDLMRSRFILLRRQATLEPKELEKIEQWKKVYPSLIDAWELKEQFFRIYDEQTPDAAREAFKQWQVDLPLTVHYQFKKVANMVKDWEEEIFNYFDSHITNAFTECANGLAKIQNRTGRGHSFDVIRWKLMYGRKPHAFRRLSMRSRMANLGIPFSTFDDPDLMNP